MAANARERFAHAEELSRKDDEIERLRTFNAELVEALTTIADFAIAKARDK